MATTDDKRAAAAAETDGPESKYTRYDDSPGSTHNLVVEFVPEHSSVLEFGCATGYMSRVLTERRGARVTGIEIDPEAAAQASAYCDRVIVGDAETLDLGEHLGEERFDAVLFADVLEHLRDPTAILRRVRPFVADGGSVVASIPNVAHISVRLALLGGEFRYRDLGLLDDTHLRFFTRASIVDLFESAGFVVSTWRRRRVDPQDAEITPPPDIPDAVGAWLGSDPELTTYQFVVRAAPSEAASQLGELRNRFRETEAEIQQAGEHARSEVAALQAELDRERSELDLLRKAHVAQARHLIKERLAFADRLEDAQGEISRLKEEVEWRKGVMEEFERRVGELEAQLARIHGSRTFRYTAPIRSLRAAFRRRDAARSP
ncbi:MAG: methyltransferase domain-containing protein [Gaiellaceae bacterium]